MVTKATRENTALMTIYICVEWSKHASTGSYPRSNCDQFRLQEDFVTVGSKQVLEEVSMLVSTCMVCESAETQGSIVTAVTTTSFALFLLTLKLLANTSSLEETVTRLTKYGKYLYHIE